MNNMRCISKKITAIYEHEELLYLRKTPQDTPRKKQSGSNLWKSCRDWRPHQSYKKDKLIRIVTKKWIDTSIVKKAYLAFLENFLTKKLFLMCSRSRLMFLYHTILRRWLYIKKKRYMSPSKEEYCTYEPVKNLKHQNGHHQKNTESLVNTSRSSYG